MIKWRFVGCKINPHAVGICNRDNATSIIWKWMTIFLRKLFSKIELISGVDRNSNMLLLRNEFSKIFEDLLTMTWFIHKMPQIYDQTKN